MASEAQVAANRANAQKSTGPRTPEGKTTVAQNAVKHGLRARTAVLLGEDGREYACFRAGILAELSPDGMQELEAATRIVDLTWQLRRAGRYQDAVLEALYDRYVADHPETQAGPDTDVAVPGDPVLGRMLLADFTGDRILERAQQYERRIESSLSRAKADLRDLRGQPRWAGLRGRAGGAGTRADSGGYRPASPAASADFTLETPRRACVPQDPPCQTKPISPGVKARGSGVGGVNPDVPPLNPAFSGQTNPIGGAVARLGHPGLGADRPGRAWDLLDQACERQPLFTGVRHPAGLVQAGERRRTGKR